MKKLLIVTLLITTCAASFGAVYHIPTGRTFDAIPQTWRAQYPHTSNLPLSPYATDFLPVQAATVPAGHVVTNRSIEVIDGVAIEQIETVTQAEYDAAQYAARIATITPDLWQTAGVFRALMREHFGPGAETNTTIKAGTVATYFINRRMTGTGGANDGQDSFFLQMAFEQIKAWTGDGTSYTFPWHLLPEDAE
jgi:hypothetical protein